MTIRAGNLDASARFYQTTLGALGIETASEGSGEAGWDDLHLIPASAEERPTRHLHVGFVARSRERVDQFWRAGIEAGYESDGEPGERPQYTPSYYGAFLLDPDGNSAEAVHHADVRRGGHVDHLWIGVRDLDASVAFYEAIMPSTGLRAGRSWEAGRQFRGAWATFSLVAGGRPVTEGLQLAFPAPDRETVEEFHARATRDGYRDAGPPAESSPGASYRAAVLDPDGTRVESVFRG